MDALSLISLDKEDKTPLKDTVPSLTLCGTEEGSKPAGEAVEYSNINGKYAGIPGEMDLVQEKKKALPINMEEVLKEQSLEPFCQESLATDGHTISLFDIDGDGRLVRGAPLKCAPQKEVSVTLWPRILYLSHYTRLIKHPGGSLMYLTDNK